MNNTTFRFSEAAKLYAEHAAVVQQMKELHRNDILSFADHLRERLRPRITTGELKEDTQPAYRNWWLQDETMDEEDDVPYLYFQVRDPAIVAPGVLTLVVAADGELKPYRPQLAAQLRNLSLPSNCQVKWQTSGLPEVQVALNQDDPVASAVEPVVMLLTAIHEADKTLRDHGSTNRAKRRR